MVCKIWQYEFLGFILRHYPCHAQRDTGVSLGGTLCVAPIKKITTMNDSKY